MTANAMMSKGAAQALLSSYESGKYSDLTIKCGEKVFRVHRVMVCQRSKVIASMVDGPFKESITGEINLPHDEPAIVQKMLDFIYTSDYSDLVPLIHDFPISPNATCPEYKVAGGSRPISTNINSSPSAADASPDFTFRSLVVDAKVYTIADIYDVQELKELATKKYKEVLDKYWNTQSFAASLREIYENTQYEDRGIKDVALAKAKEHIKALLNRGDFVELVKHNAELSFDLLSQQVKDQKAEDEEDTDSALGTRAYCYSKICNGKSALTCIFCGDTAHFKALYHGGLEANRNLNVVNDKYRGPYGGQAACHSSKCKGRSAGLKCQECGNCGLFFANCKKS